MLPGRNARWTCSSARGSGLRVRRHCDECSWEEMIKRSPKMERMIRFRRRIQQRVDSPPSYSTVHHPFSMYPNGYGNGSPAGPSYSSTAIPAPIPKASYAPPVFQTFQDRKRAKEAALRASIEPAPPLYAPPPNVPSQPQPPMTFGAPHSASIPSLQPNSSRPLPLPRGPPVPTEQTPSSSHSRTQSPVEATLERSDTLASIRSLDRSGFSTTRRPLPKPPTKVNSSRSLDRGILDKGIQGGMSRRKPSDIPEEEERSPAKFSPLPAISIEVPQISFGNGDPVADITVDSPSPPSPGPGIVVSNIPSISVTTDAPSPVRLDTDAAIICAGCGNSIIGKILNAMKKRFHPQCFACSECGENLEHVSSYEWEGKAYCHLDYHDVSERDSA